ncbi:hypothetical protein V6N13_107334 [Hibiscus sabdariffa]|uniref:DUF4283 domain-containing protein n=1 Tax=Hibiscus sabdariffa TaxID=183260 RepID=A0ABR2SPB6_9ROSI
MQVSGPMILFMFSYVETHRKIMNSRVLLQWFEYVLDWSSDIKMKSRRVWLSVSGIPVQAWSRDTFTNIARAWDSSVRLDHLTSEPTSFERTRILIDTDQVGNQMYEVRV